MATENKIHLEPYEPPTWATGLPIRPKWKLKLAMTPTPIHRWYLPGIPDDVELYIKREDMNGSVLSGNKVRKLEFLLADALAQGCRHVITTGGLQSNHCSATAIAARQLGLKPHLVIRSNVEQPDYLGCRGNMFLKRLTNADFYVVPGDKMSWAESADWMKVLAAKIQAETGENAYTIPVSGSTIYGAYAYINAYKELLNQDAASRFDDVIVAAATGGTVEGMTIGNHLSGAGLKIHCVSVHEESKFIYDRIDDTLRSFQLNYVKAQDIHDAIDGHVGDGQLTEEDTDFLLDVAAKTGIILEPEYDGKTARVLIQELNCNRDRFKGNRILFLHTGGIFGMFGGQLDESLLLKTNPNVKFWPSVDENPQRRSSYSNEQS